jgi:zinc D-Ala-D-Ala carboxypeptidase
MPRTSWPWVYFSRAEMQCRHCGACHTQASFLDRLDTLRMAYGRPMVVASGYRCPAHNQAVSRTGPDGPHTQCAVDIRVYGAHARALLGLAVAYGFTGIGVQQAGPIASRFLHLDLCTEAPGRPRPTLWSY